MPEAQQFGQKRPAVTVRDAAGRPPGARIPGATEGSARLAEKVEQRYDNARMLKHDEWSWSVAGGGTYLVRCECGWSKLTFAATPETSIQTTYEDHLRMPSSRESHG